MASAPACRFGSGLLRRGCGREAITDCVYCTEPFCEAHGERAEDYLDVCARKRCREKLLDLRAHSHWRQSAAASNRLSVCAIEECAERMRHQCSRCRLLFCADHVRDREVSDHSVRPARKVLALVCAHCADRTRLWA